MRRYGFFLNVCIIAISALFASCGKAGSRPLLSINNHIPEEEIVFTRWRVLGPFGEQEKKDDQPLPEEQVIKHLYNHDYLARFGIAESQVEYANLSGLSSEDDFLCEDADTDGHVLDLGKILQVDRPAVAYAAREIEVNEPQDVLLVAEMQGMGLKVWLNNEPVIERDREGSLSRFENFKPVHLNKGKNLLLAKIVSNKKWFRFVASLMTRELARDNAREYGMNRVVKKNIIRKEEDLELDLLLDKPASVREVEILDSRKNLLDRNKYHFKEDGRLELEDLDEGLYYCRVAVPSDRFETEFYRGDVEAALAAYKKRVAAFSSDEQTRINLEALLIRYEHLLVPENRNGNKTEWEVKVVYVINELETILRDLESGLEAFKHSPGRHMRGFRSRIDDQVAHYMVYVPPQYAQTREPIPLVVFVPYDQWPQRPFLKSVYVAYTELIEHFTKAADRDGYAVLWTDGSGTRGGSSLNQKGMTDILSTIEAVEKDYAIDNDRIYLWGSCAGGRDAVMLASRFPDKFAALSLVGLFSETETIERGDKVSKPHAKEWLMANSPIYCVENLSNIPIYVLVPEFDEHISIEDSAKYVEKCRELGMNARLEVMSYAHTNYYPQEPIGKTLGFYKGIVRRRHPAQVQLSTWQLKYGSAYWLKIHDLVETMKCARIKAAIDTSNTVTVETENVRAYEIKMENLDFDRSRPLTVRTNGQVSFSGVPGESIVIGSAEPAGDQSWSSSKNALIEGPILHAFTDGFIVVEGTQGSLKDRQTAGALCEAFCQAWREDYLQDCLHKKDYEITGQEIEQKNLVLFGNDQTNSFVKRVIGQVPVKFSTTGIAVGSKTYQGANLGVRLIYPNPLNKNRYIVIIGGNDMTNLPFDAKCLAIEGWYDFMVWKPWEADQSLIDIGYFNQRWSEVISLIRA